jgi:hypothetical protein
MSDPDTIPGQSRDPIAMSFDSNRGPIHPEKKRVNDETKPSLTGRLRGGGADLHQAGLFGWLRQKPKLDKGKGRAEPNVVTYHGRAIGPPQPAQLLDTPPLASNLHQDNTFNNVTPISPLNNGYDINGNYIPTPTRQGRHSLESDVSLPPPPPLPLAIPTKHSRPVTTNPFAAIYGNPHVNRVQPKSPLIDYAAAGSIVDRPSALEGPYTGYLSESVGHGRGQQCGASGQVSGRSGGVNSLEAPNKAGATKDLSAEVSDNRSVRTRDWDLQSCTTEELSVDHLLRNQQQLAQRQTNHRNMPTYLRQDKTRNNDKPFNVPQEEGGPSPESVFHAELIDIVKAYHHNRRVLTRAFEAGEISEMQLRRDVHRYGTAMDLNVRAAAASCGYHVSTQMLK